MSRWRPGALIALPLAFALAAGAMSWPAGARALPPPSPFQIGFADSLFSGAAGGLWASRAASAGADSIRVNVYWSAVASRRPDDPRDPDDPAYDFGAVDRAVRNADDSSLGVLMTVLSAPVFAEGPGRPPHEVAPPGTWRPDAGDFGDFAHALAVRYSGTHAPPDATVLPEVNLYSAWNEPNTTAYLSPQFVGGENTGAAIYVRLLNSFYEQVTAVNADAVITTGGTAPFGDGDKRRTSPLAFWRHVMCLTESLQQAAECIPAEKPEFDALAHHPISYLSSPRVPAANPDDVTIADFAQLGELLRAAESLGTVRPDEVHTLIAPEIWWESNPPERRGVPVKRQARYAELGLYLLWKQGAVGAWFLQLRDQHKADDAPRLHSYQTGIYTYGGRKKPIYRAIQFPFVTDRVDAHELLAWGRSPVGGRMRIERERGNGKGWRRLATLPVRGGQVFTRELRLAGDATLRARIGRHRSLPWRQRAH